MVLGAIPVAAFTFLTLQWSISTGRLNKFTDKEDLKKQFKNSTKARKEAKAQAKLDKYSAKMGGVPITQPVKKPLFDKSRGADIFHNKLLSFGGGFYGTMALITYVLIEIKEIYQFLGKILQPSTWLDNLGIGLIIDLIINSITNLIAAFVWFLTLPDYISMQNGFIWLAAAYGGYLYGLKVVKENGDEVWSRLATHSATFKTKIKDQLKTISTGLTGKTKK